MLAISRSLAALLQPNQSLEPTALAMLNNIRSAAKLSFAWVERDIDSVVHRLNSVVRRQYCNQTGNSIELRDDGKMKR